MKKLFIILFFATVIANGFAQDRVLNYDFSAVCESGQTLYYTILNDHEVALDDPQLQGYTAPWGGYTKPEGDLVIPETVNNEGITYTVVVLGDNALAECQGLTSVVLPNSIRRIEAEAFVFCHNLNGAMVIPDQCTFIGCYAFWECYSLTSLTVGASVDTIQFSAFEDCTGLQFIHCNTPTPPFAQHLPSGPYYEDRSIFNNVPTDIPVQVNCLTIDQFQMDQDWSRFTNMSGVFLGAPSLTVEVNNPEYGTAEVVSIPEDCDHSTATIRAIPNPGHVFGYWKRNGAVVSFTPEYTFVLDHNCVMTACFDCSVIVYDSIGYPDHVVGRTFNASGQVTDEHISDFSYNENGELTQFSFPEDRYTDFSFFEYPSKPSSISCYLGGHPATFETLHFLYEDDHQIRHSDHYRGNDYYDEINNHYDYYYNDHRLYQKISSCTENGETWIFARNLYSYENGNKIRIDSAYSGTRLSTVTTTVYDDAHRIQNLQTVSFNASGEISSRTQKVYTYSSNNKTDTIITRTLIDGEWVNSDIAHYVYDIKNRVVEYQTGSWSVENSRWDITKKVLYGFNDETQKVTISFRKKIDGEWVWDVFSGQSLFNDSQLYEWQRQLNTYSAFEVNQFEISMHYDMVETVFPVLSEWYYEIQMEDGDITYQHLEYASDTTVNNDRTKIIVRTNQIYDKEGQTFVTHEYIKEQNNKVYWWNKDLEEFTLLYDYNAGVGDEWEIKVGTESITVHVDDVDVFEYDGETFRRMYISDVGNVFNGAIVVGIGHTTSFFPEQLMAKNNFEVNGLRCYWVGDALLFHQGDEDCDAIHSSFTSTSDTNAGDFRLYPNPTTGLLHVEMSPDVSLPSEYRITNIVGQTLLTGRSLEIDLSSLPSGLYFITLGYQTLKFTKQ